MTKPREIALLRLAAGRIVGDGFSGASEAVRWLTAAQAQDFPGTLAAVALRTRERTRAAVIGTWKKAGAGSTQRVQPAPFTTFSATTEVAITESYQAYP